MNAEMKQELEDAGVCTDIRTEQQPASLWQAEIILASLAAGEIDEPQAVLLGTLYFKANWRTRVLADFRAERACEWLGKSPAYTRTMQRRLQALRELGWFTWSYVRGTKLPYDITMRADDECARHRHTRDA